MYLTRSASGRGAALIAELIRAAFEEYRGAPLEPPASALKESAASVLNMFAAGEIAFVSESTDRLLRCIFARRDGMELYLHRLAVHPDS